MSRVVMIIMDSLPHRWVGPSITPTLWRLAGEGGQAPTGGRGVLTAATYANHATFATGDEPAVHGVYANDVLVDGGWRPAATVGTSTPTLFDRCTERGLVSVAVLGDQHLVGVMGAERASLHWPPGGELPPGTERDLFQYAADAAVVDAVSRTDVGSADLAVIHLNEPDTAAHWFGPDSEEALDVYRRTDAALAAIVERLRPRWDDTVAFLVSDHDQESLDPDVDAIDVGAELSARGWPGHVYPEGTAALVMHGPSVERLREIPGVEGATTVGAGATVVWGGPGRSFGPEVYRLRGSHGSPRTATQVAIVAGGHPAVGALSGRLASAPPPATAWARWAAELLGLEPRH